MGSNMYEDVIQPERLNQAVVAVSNHQMTANVKNFNENFVKKHLPNSKELLLLKNEFSMKVNEMNKSIQVILKGLKDEHYWSKTFNKVPNPITLSFLREKYIVGFSGASVSSGEALNGTASGGDVSGNTVNGDISTSGVQTAVADTTDIKEKFFYNSWNSYYFQTGTITAVFEVFLEFLGLKYPTFKTALGTEAFANAVTKYISDSMSPLIDNLGEHLKPSNPAHMKERKKSRKRRFEEMNAESEQSQQQQQQSQQQQQPQIQN